LFCTWNCRFREFAIDCCGRVLIYKEIREQRVKNSISLLKSNPPEGFTTAWPKKKNFRRKVKVKNDRHIGGS